jgi:triosephosphate isomerase
MPQSRRALVAANWKMHGSQALVAAFVTRLSAVRVPATLDVVIMPPSVYLAELASSLAGTGVAAGAQNLHALESGAFTGELSGEMLREAGARWAIVGHSERRHEYGETDEVVAAKFVAALRAGLTPVLCVGETLEERDAGRAEAVVEAQLRAVLEVAGATALGAGVVAYEPVWAIGTGRTASATQAQRMHAHVRGVVAQADAKVAAALRIVYGGSVNPDNATELFAQPDVDGGLVGGAGLDVDRFLAIVGAAA